MLRLWFDNDKYLDCTPDHLIMMRDGTYKEAQNLEINDLKSEKSRLSDQIKSNEEGCEQKISDKNSLVSDFKRNISLLIKAQDDELDRYNIFMGYYSTGLDKYHKSSFYSNEAFRIYESSISFTNQANYDYYVAMDYYDEGLNQVNKALELSENSLENYQKATFDIPNDIFIIEIEERIMQVNALNTVCDSLKKSLLLLRTGLFELNYGSISKGNKAYAEYEREKSLLKERQKELIIIQDKIDVRWDNS